MLYGWKENSMLTHCLAACANLTITISEIQRYICEKIVILSYPLHSTPPLGGFPSEYRHPLWYGKTRMVSLPVFEKISKICLFVLTWSTNVADRRTDTAWQQRPRLCIASRGKNLSRNTYHTRNKLNLRLMLYTMRHCWHWPSVNLEIAKNIFWEYWLKNFQKNFGKI